ncbi:hypothetical protein ACS3UN_09970 [Oscillospiraceae bacterium LTW-04]|nr:hypothetical protein RBH76_11720 [Oscillospiraceae bacterium MB24-C1]
MSKFDFMTFGYDAGDEDMFVTHASKYTAEETVVLCKRECAYKFRDRTIFHNRILKALREPTVSDVQDMYCAFRFGNPEWPDGCYALVGPTERGAFPVRVIDFGRLV